jgi:hypothetical protein
MRRQGAPTLEQRLATIENAIKVKQRELNGLEARIAALADAPQAQGTPIDHGLTWAMRSDVRKVLVYFTDAESAERFESAVNMGKFGAPAPAVDPIASVTPEGQKDKEPEEDARVGGDR